MKDKLIQNNNNLLKITNDWVNIKISDLSDNVIAGATPSTSISDYWDGDIPWMSSGEINKRVIFKTDKLITRLGYEECSTKLIPRHCVLIALAGQGKTRGMVAINEIELCTNQSLATIIPKRHIIIHKYLFYNLLNRYEEIRRMSTNSEGGRGGLNSKIINNIIVKVPPLKEQQKIVQILSIWDLSIEKQEQLIEKKKEFKKGLMQVLYSQGTRKETRVKTKLGEVPVSWKVIKAKEVFDSVSIKNNEDEELLSVTQDRGTIPRTLLEGSVVMPEGSTNGYKLVVPNNFIISLRSFQGGLEISQYRGLISPAYTVLENKIDICHDYFKYYFKKEEFISRLNAIIVGIRDGKQISYTDFGEMYLPLPPIEEQNKIAEILMLSDKEIELLQKELEAVKLQKKGLMQRLLTGEVRVNIQ